MPILAGSHHNKRVSKGNITTKTNRINLYNSAIGIAFSKELTKALSLEKTSRYFPKSVEEPSEEFYIT